MTAEFIAGAFGLLVSLLFKVVKPLDRWFYTVLNPDYRGLVMAGFSLLIPFGVLGLSCLGVMDTVACSTNVIPEIVRAWFAFLVTNVGTFLMTPNSHYSKVVKEQKLQEAVAKATGNG